MLLNIPILDLLHSQLDIAVDPLSGKLTCNVKDIPSRLRPSALHVNDLTLTLRSSSEDSDSGTLCIRVSSAQVAASSSSMNVVEAPQFHALAPSSLLDRSGYDAHSLTSGLLIPASHGQGFGNMDSMFGHSSGSQGSLEAMMNDASIWGPLHAKLPEHSSDSHTMSPVSQALSMISSGSLIEDFGIYSSPTTYTFSDSQHDTLDVQANHASCSGGNAIYHSPDPANSMMDVQEAPGGSSDPAPGGSFSIIDLFSSAPPSETPSPTSSAAVSPKHGQTSPEPHRPTPSRRHSTSSNEERPGSSTTQSDSQAQPARGSKRETYPCPYPSCGRVLKSMYTQQIHLKTHEGKPQKNFPCTMGCSESFTRHHDRLRHEVAQHGKQCEFSCKRCERFFSSQRMLNRHTCWSWRNGSLRWQLKDFADSSRSDA